VIGSVVFAAIGGGSFAEHKRLLQISGAALWFAVLILLKRRFKPYLDQPPVLSNESEADRSLMIRFRAISIGTFVAVCVVGYTLHEVGLKLL
jgi:hypothetical protein